MDAENVILYHFAKTYKKELALKVQGMMEEIGVDGEIMTDPRYLTMWEAHCVEKQTGSSYHSIYDWDVRKYIKGKPFCAGLIVPQGSNLPTDPGFYFSK